MGMPLAIAVRLLPTPTTVMTWRTPAGHMAWRHRNGRTQPCDLQAAVILLREIASSPPGPVGAAAGRMLPTPDTGTSPRGHGRRGGRPGNEHQSGHDLDTAVRALHPPGPRACPQLPDAGHSRAGAPSVTWGPYETAIRRWEHALGCPAPPPAEPGPGQRLRLAAAFAEWLMGIPGWVTQVPGISRTAQLRIIGNGVVPQQAAAALELLIQAACAVPSDPGLAGEQGQEAAA
jgi:hypothetical protein